MQVTAIFLSDAISQVQMITVHWRIQGGGRDAPSGSKFFHFHAVFCKKMQNNRLAHPLRKILDLPLWFPDPAYHCKLLCRNPFRIHIHVTLNYSRMIKIILISPMIQFS